MDSTSGAQNAGVASLVLLRGYLRLAALAGPSPPPSSSSSHSKAATAGGAQMGASGSPSLGSSRASLPLSPPLDLLPVPPALGGPSTGLPRVACWPGRPPHELDTAKEDESATGPAGGGGAAALLPGCRAEEGESGPAEGIQSSGSFGAVAPARLGLRAARRAAASEGTMNQRMASASVPPSNVEEPISSRPSRQSSNSARPEIS
mmetsp:Transcript_24368/g.67744  ORF Transcript_24368/g.67744 Transcript_24368/m.67744 type:complete len:205 (+) Transcript_24368:926-1540(+)